MGPGVIPMSTYADDVRTSSEPGPAPAPEAAASTWGTSAGGDHSDCPYCGDTGRDQVRKYRFCGHGAP